MSELTTKDDAGWTASAARAAVQHGRVVALFQPIESLQTGACKGFEALARIVDGDRQVAPDDFLSLLDEDDRLCLFGAMLGQGIALIKANGAGRSDLYVSINVEISLLVSESFVDVLQYFLERYDFGGERVVLEMLEHEDVGDIAKLHAAIDAVRGLGLSVALDDIGSAYASLTKIKALPIDIFKLDRYFSRDLEQRPEDLMFVMSMLSLARGLDKRMIVEGIETPEVYDALRIIGVEFGQGYAIARPMPADAVPAWLAARVTRAMDRQPLCMFGAYASHMTVMEACRNLRRQPLPIAWTPAATDHRRCVIGQLFGLRGWHGTEFGIAHRKFHEVLALYDEDPERWLAGADRFRAAMAAVIVSSDTTMKCKPVEVGALGPSVPAESEPTRRKRTRRTAAA